MAKNLVLCDCLGSQAIDRTGLEAATGLRCSPVFNSLCTTQIKQASAALAEGDAIICCGQEQRVFEALAAEIDVEQIKWVVLMVLFNQPGQEANFAWMEDLMFDTEQEYRL